MRRIKLCIMATMLCLLFGCGKQEKTANETIQETTTATDSSSFQSDFKKASINELKGMLDEIDKHSKNLTDSSNAAISDAVSLLNWGVGTTLTTAEINDVTTSWLNAMGSDEKKGVISWLTQVNKIYMQLLTDGQKDFLTSAGFGDAPYPWSSTPLETVDEIMKKAGIK